MNMNKKKYLELNNKSILVTGSPGFIGAHLVIKLLNTISRSTIISLDNMNDYYETALKEHRLNRINTEAKHSDNQHVFILGDISDKEQVKGIFEKYNPDIVVNLAAQAGVRYSITNPDAYIRSNIVGFYNVLEACRQYAVKHLVFASSSSVYGNTEVIPFSTDAKADEPVSLYAATKRSDEMLAYSYSKLYDIPSTGLRFFTVYGPAGRPDMFYYSATENLIKGNTIKLFNYGKCKRDYTYIDDIVDGIIKVMQGAPQKSETETAASVPYAIYNIGNGTPVSLMDFICILEKELVSSGLLPRDFDFEKHHEFVDMQPGDVVTTYADTSSLEQDYGYKPSTDFSKGIHMFARWYSEYTKIR